MTLWNYWLEVSMTHDSSESLQRVYNVQFETKILLLLDICTTLFFRDVLLSRFLALYCSM